MFLFINQKVLETQPSATASNFEIEQNEFKYCYRSIVFDMYFRLAEKSTNTSSFFLIYHLYFYVQFKLTLKKLQLVNWCNVPAIFIYNLVVLRVEKLCS